MSANEDLPRRWATTFGLALAPLFESEEGPDGGMHQVLLDGGLGSFALSVDARAKAQGAHAADWAWSSDLPHHVSVTEDRVIVTRWDRVVPDQYSRSSIESRLEDFHTFLSRDRVRSSDRVTEHALHLFRRSRSLVAEARMPDERSIDIFLALLGRVIELDRQTWRAEDNRSVILGSEQREGLLRALPEQPLQVLQRDFFEPSGSRSHRLYPALAVRHAGSQIFQEAHFELLRAPGADLFGYMGPAQARPVTRGGAHFTPPALARAMAEQTLNYLEGMSTRRHLSILDPACGSGAFLHEVLRALRRTGFSGKITLIGRDISPAAIAMADFVVRQAVADWFPAGGVSFDLQVADSLDSSLPKVDVVVMNPPFIAWPALDDRQREQVKRVLGPGLKGRGDISMAFITHVLPSISEGGAMGVLFPSSLLVLKGAQVWRSHLMEQADVRFLGSFGDFGLFPHALVTVGSAVFARSATPRITRPIHAVVTSNHIEATASALRALRKGLRHESEDAEAGHWSVFDLPLENLRNRPTWRLMSPRTAQAFNRLLESGAARIGDLFDVHQGVRTGDNEAFLLNKQEYDSLRPRERRYFRPAVINESVQAGQLDEVCWIFYPYDERGSLFKSETELLRAVPTYAKSKLLPVRKRLVGRPSNRDQWWELSERRSSWALRRDPRIVSKYFGGCGGFAADVSARFLVVQGFAWFPRWTENQSLDDDESKEPTVEGLLYAYAALFNSPYFARILGMFSPHVAGGQYDLSPRYIEGIPLPNLSALAGDAVVGPRITRLTRLGSKLQAGEPEWAREVDQLTIDLYGGEFIAED